MATGVVPGDAGLKDAAETGGLVDPAARADRDDLGGDPRGLHGAFVPGEDRVVRRLAVAVTGGQDGLRATRGVERQRSAGDVDEDRPAVHVPAGGPSGIRGVAELDDLDLVLRAELDRVRVDVDRVAERAVRDHGRGGRCAARRGGERDAAADDGARQGEDAAGDQEPTWRLRKRSVHWWI